MKKTIFVSALGLSSLIGYTQNWVTTLNSGASSPKLGTSTNDPLSIYTNNALRLKIDGSGHFILNDLIGTGNRLVQVDQYGQFSAFPPGTSSQVLHGDGTWGSLPAAINSFGTTGSGSSLQLYANVPFFGIGMTNPGMALDVAGDIRTSSSLRVNSGLLLGSTGQLPITYAASSGAGSPQVLNFGSSLSSNNISNLLCGPNPFQDDAASAAALYPFYGQVSIVSSGAGSGPSVNIFATSSGAAIFSKNSDLYINDCGPNVLLCGGAAGNVGIGSHNVNNKLDVETSDPVWDGINVVQNGTYASALHLINAGTSGKHWALYSTGNSNSQGAGNFSIYDYAASADRLFISGSTGNVGVGTTGPQCKFQVSDPTAAQIDIFTTGSNAAKLTVSNSGRQFYFSTLNSAGHIGTSTGSGDVNLINFTTDATSGQPSVWIGDPTGAPNVAHLSINTSNATSALDVYNPTATSPANKIVFRVKNTGSVYAQEMTVQVANYPDYVFKNDYQLMPLENLESFIQKNQHLPSVPSAEEIKSNGANLGELNKIQMEKIEELTLYIIQLNKEIEKLKSK